MTEWRVLRLVLIDFEETTGCYFLASEGAGAVKTEVAADHASNAVEFTSTELPTQGWSVAPDLVFEKPCE